MKAQFRRLSMLALLAAISLAGCKNSVVSTEAPVSALVYGVVVGSNSLQPLIGVTVVISHDGSRDSVITGSDGTFQFIIDVPDTIRGVDVTLAFRKVGFLSKSVTATVKRDQAFSEGLDVDPAAYAIVTGVVRDSASAYPLGGASVIISLPSGSSIASELASKMKSHRYSVSSFIVDSTTSLMDGSFSMNVDLFDLDSIAATMIISKPGFRTYQQSHVFTRGANSFGTIPLSIDNSKSFAHIAGRVTDRASGYNIRNAAVTLSTSLGVDTTYSQADGSYSFDLNLQGLSSASGSLFFRLNSYNDTTLQVSVAAGQTLNQNVALTPKPVFVVDSTISGVAKSFKLVGVTKSEISIAGASTGMSNDESSTITWQVLDSLGNPVDNTHRYKVTFSISETPNGLGGATIIPDTMSTDGSGKVYATIVSGTAAGVIQVLAELSLSNGSIVRATPVPITVDAGLPDQAHFELNSNPPHARNFAGYDWSEVTQGFTAQVGDVYSNPVAAGTALYFNTTSGIVTGAAQTDASGHGNTTLSSGLPLPFISPAKLASVTGLDAAYFGTGDGYAFVKAWTMGANGVAIGDSDLICISARALYPSIELLSPSDTVHSGGSLLYHIRITDRFGNPLESGTKVSASVIVPPPPPSLAGNVWSVQAAGLGNAASGAGLTLGDNLVRNIYSYPSQRELGSTDFEVTVSATLTQGSASVTTFTLVIDIQGRNTDNHIFETTVSGVAVAP